MILRKAIVAHSSIDGYPERMDEDFIGVAP
jgi:hypothetical protein